MRTNKDVHSNISKDFCDWLIKHSKYIGNSYQKVGTRCELANVGRVRLVFGFASFRTAFCRLWNFAGNSGESWIDWETSWFWAGCNPREVSSNFCNLCDAEKTNTSLIKTKSRNWDRELTLVIIQSQAAIHSDMLVTKPWICINSNPESKKRRKLYWHLQQANNNGSKRWGKLCTSWYVAKLSSAVVICTESASQDADRHKMYATE